MYLPCSYCLLCILPPRVEMSSESNFVFILNSSSSLLYHYVHIHSFIFSQRVLWRKERKSRSTQTVPCLDSVISSSSSSACSFPEDPTPSLSWDNLTPDPSPALATERDDQQETRHQGTGVAEEGEEEEEEEKEKNDEENGDEEVEDKQEVGEGNANNDSNVDARTDSTLPSWAASYGLVFREKRTLSSSESGRSGGR